MRVSGNGPPLLFLHSEIGLTWDNFLADLAANHTVYAPEFPGTAAGDADAIHQYDDLLDVVLAYEEVVRALGLERAVVIGHSFGGMLAAELAAVFPELFSGVVLIDAFGLWSSTDPTSSDLMAGPYERLPEVLFHDPHCPAAQSMRIPSCSTRATRWIGRRLASGRSAAPRSSSGRFPSEDSPNAFTESLRPR